MHFTVIIILLLGTLIFSSVSTSKAEVIDFDNVLLDGAEDNKQKASKATGGFTWGKSWGLLSTVENVDGALKSDSGRKLLINTGKERQLFISRDTDFNFKGLYIGKPNATNSDLKNKGASWVRIRGFDANDNIVATTDKINLNKEMTWVNTEFKNIRKIDFLYEGFNTYFTVDKLTYGPIHAPVTITSAVLLLIPTLIGFIALIRKGQSLFKVRPSFVAL